MERVSILIHHREINISSTQIYPDINFDEKQVLSNQMTNTDTIKKVFYSGMNDKDNHQNNADMFQKTE